MLPYLLVNTAATNKFIIFADNDNEARKVIEYNGFESTNKSEQLDEYKQFDWPYIKDGNRYYLWDPKPAPAKWFEVKIEGEQIYISTCQFYDIISRYTIYTCTDAKETDLSKFTELHVRGILTKPAARK